MVGSQVWAFGQQQHLHRSTCLGASAQETCREHATLVSDEQITGTQVGTNLVKMPMLQCSRGSLDDQQAGDIARLNGSLGGQFWRQIIVKIADLQGVVHKPAPFPPPGGLSPRCW